MIDSNKYEFLLFFGAVDSNLKECINLSFDPETKTAEIGMFAVRSDLQARGYGKFILSVAENYAVDNWNAEYMELNTIVQKPELLGYYIRRGYVDTIFQ